MPGEKFTVRHGVAAAQIYTSDPGNEKLIIPPPDHFLYDESSPTEIDEQKVRQIDEDGECTHVIEVWTDKDKKVMYVLDGRETLMNLREVNRRRAADKRKPLLVHIKPVASLEKEAVAHMTVRNFHRRIPPSSAYALRIRACRKQGYTWDKICDFLLIKSDDAEQWCKKRLPLAYAEPEVRRAFDAGELPLAHAPQFGGRAEDGSEAEGREDQLGLLESLRAEKLAGAGKPKPVAAAARKRVRQALLNGESANLCHKDATAAEVAAATIAYLDGDRKAFDEWPEVRAIMERAAAKKAKTKSEP